PRTPIEEMVTSIWSEVLGVQQISIHDNFFELGGDSILSIQIVGKAKAYGLHFTYKQLFQNPTIAQLANVIVVSQSRTIEQGLITGDVPLTPVQHWFFEQNFTEPHHWNQALMLEARQRLNTKYVTEAIQYLIIHHDALRLRFIKEALGWRQTIVAPTTDFPITTVDLSEFPVQKQKDEIERVATQAQTSLNLSDGPLIRTIMFELGDQFSQRLLIIAHHLIIDAVSWRILLEDLQRIYKQLDSSVSITLPTKTTSWQYWSNKLNEYTQSNQMEKEADYWLGVLRNQVDLLPRDHVDGINTVKSTATVSISLNEKDTQALLREVPSAYHTEINEVLITALVETIWEWSGSRRLFMELEGHGREDIFEEVDLSCTIGWFTTIFPVYIDLSKTYKTTDALKSVKEQLRKIPNRGLSYGVLHYLKRDPRFEKLLINRPTTEISFNYLGQFDQVFSNESLLTIGKESSGTTRSQYSLRSHVLEIIGSILDGKLNMAWIFSENLHKRTTIERLSQSYIEHLRKIIVHCRNLEAVTYTTSDFPRAGLSQKSLDKLITKLNRQRKPSVLPASPTTNLEITDK
ncbi:MAG: condensation domain-containing protein, partial [Acidobacteriota bacterium]